MGLIRFGQGESTAPRKPIALNGVAMKRWPTLIGLFAFFAVASVLAQNVIQAEIQGQPLVYMKDGSLSGCGVRVLLIDAPANLTNQSPLTVYDASFNVYAAGHGVVKGGMYDISAGDFKTGDIKGKARFVTLEAFWFKVAGFDATAPVKGKIVRGEDPGTVLYAAEVERVLPLFIAQERNDPILMGTRRPGGKAERIFSGRIAMSPAEREQVAGCLRELVQKK